MQVKSIAECSKGSILQYFRPSLSYHFPLRPLFCLFLSDRLRQGLLYIMVYCCVHSRKGESPPIFEKSPTNFKKDWGVGDGGYFYIDKEEKI